MAATIQRPPSSSHAQAVSSASDSGSDGQNHLTSPALNFLCSHCCKVVGEGCPVYMRSDQSYCSPGCRSRGPSELLRGSMSATGRGRSSAPRFDPWQGTAGTRGGARTRSRSSCRSAASSRSCSRSCSRASSRSCSNASSRSCSRTTSRPVRSREHKGGAARLALRIFDALLKHVSPVCLAPSASNDPVDKTQSEGKSKVFGEKAGKSILKPIGSLANLWPELELEPEPDCDAEHGSKTTPSSPRILPEALPLPVSHQEADSKTTPMPTPTPTATPPLSPLPTTLQPEAASRLLGRAVPAERPLEPLTCGWEKPVAQASGPHERWKSLEWRERNTNRPPSAMENPEALTTRMLLERRMQTPTPMPAQDPLHAEIEFLERWVTLADAVPKSAESHEVAIAKTHVVTQARCRPFDAEMLEQLDKALNTLVLDIIGRGGRRGRKPELAVVEGSWCPDVQGDVIDSVPVVDGQCKSCCSVDAWNSDVASTASTATGCVSVLGEKTEASSSTPYPQTPDIWDQPQYFATHLCLSLAAQRLCQLGLQSTEGDQPGLERQSADSSARAAASEAEAEAEAANSAVGSTSSDSPLEVDFSGLDHATATARADEESESIPEVWPRTPDSCD